MSELSPEIQSYYANPLALASGIRRSAVRMPMNQAVDLWARIGLACHVKPSTIMAAIREAEVQHWGQRLESMNRRLVGRFVWLPQYLEPFATYREREF